MIKITDEQKQRFTDNDLLNLPASLIVSDFLKSLTIDQIKQLAESKGASVVEWVEFDVNDKDTHPKAESFVIIAQQATNDTSEARFYPPNFIERHEGFCHPSMRGNFKNVTHWAYLPSKEK